MGKARGDDRRAGKSTLPLIVAMQRGSAEQAAIVIHAIEEGSTDRLDDVVTLVRMTGARQPAGIAANSEARRAMAAAEQLPPGAHSTSLLQLAAQLLERRA